MITCENLMRASRFRLISVCQSVQITMILSTVSCFRRVLASAAGINCENVMRASRFRPTSARQKAFKKQWFCRRHRVLLHFIIILNN